jgi:hypothetical protein
MKFGMISRGTFPKRLSAHTGIERNNRDADVVVNYGVQGQGNQHRIDAMYLNKYQHGNKLEDIRAIQEHVQCPQSTEDYKLVLETGEENWIAKPYWSFAGKGIMPAKQYDTYGGPRRCYYQKSLQYTRAFELRVHYFRWMPIDGWMLQEKVHKEGNDALTWNHHSGGSFNTVNTSKGKFYPGQHNTGVFRKAKEMTAIAGPILGYQFGAADFIVTQDNEVYFIEWNLAPGVTIRPVKDYYYNAFNELQLMSREDIAAMGC